VAVIERELTDRESSESELEFEVGDVTGTHHVHVSGVQPSLPVGVVAKTLAAQMMLPSNTFWSLHNGQGAILDEERPIGEQLSPGEKVTLSPKAHLG
jgi:hypothetical protein